MKWYAPDYYGEFACIAGKCKHSCCIGWEIDIDAETLERYRSLPGEWGRRLCENIAVDGDTASFRLTDDERCPILNREGLCELILHFGEESLCQICTDHPRFRSFLDSRVEIGLGLCCEEAARLILSRAEPARMVLLEDDGNAESPSAQEQAFLQWRDRQLTLAQDRSMPLLKRIRLIAQDAGIVLEQIEQVKWQPFLLGLERMEPQWGAELAKMERTASLDWARWEVPFEQLLVYLLTRHLPAALEADDERGHLAFALFAWQLVRAVFASQPLHSMEALVETARMFSAEIEYSDENVDAIIDELRQVAGQDANLLFDEAAGIIRTDIFGSR